MNDSRSTQDIPPAAGSSAMWGDPARGPDQQYRLLERLGEGGFGEVFLARQQWPVVRQVAIKILKRPAIDDAAQARFRAEMQTLASLSHPGIAAIFDAGQWTDGRPFFVMEFVPGVAITEYCDQQRLPLDVRLRLMRDACEAVHHAHGRQIIHRDLKPTNMLVAALDGRPIVKLIDFGVAKLQSTTPTPDHPHTGAGQAVGTYAYMSPEQADGNILGVDARSDVYSLGVLLYQLAVGVLPITSLAQAGAAGSRALAEQLRHERLRTPSEQFTSLDGPAAARIADRRSAEPTALVSQLRRGLDAVIMKALERDPARRHPSARDMAQAIDALLTSHAGVPGAPGAPTNRAGSRRRVYASLALAVAIAGVAVAAWLALQFWPSRAAEGPGRPGTASAATPGQAQTDPGSGAEPAASLIDELHRDLPLPQLSFELVGRGPEVRVRGAVVNENDLQRVRARVERYGHRVQLEVTTDAAVVARALERRLRELGASQALVQVRRRPNFGAELLAVRYQATMEHPASRVRAEAERFVIDADNIELTDSVP